MSKIVIGCKMPSGFLVEAGAPGDSDYRAVKILGANDGETRVGGLFVPRTVGGFGRTEIEGSVWNAWKTGADIVGTPTYDPRTGAELVSVKTNRDALVKARRALVDEWMSKGVVFEVETPDLALAVANEKAAVKTGFEPLQQKNDPRAPSRVTVAAA